VVIDHIQEHIFYDLSLPTVKFPDFSMFPGEWPPCICATFLTWSRFT